jgi:hypothetical protein
MNLSLLRSPRYSVLSVQQRHTVALREDIGFERPKPWVISRERLAFDWVLDAPVDHVAQQRDALELYLVFGIEPNFFRMYVRLLNPACHSDGFSHCGIACLSFSRVAAAPKLGTILSRYNRDTRITAFLPARPCCRDSSGAPNTRMGMTQATALPRHRGNYLAQRVLTNHI